MALAWIAKLVQGVAGLGGTVVLALVGADRPANFWTGSRHDWIIVLAVIGLAVAAVLTPLVQAADSYRKARGEDFRSDVGDALGGILVEIQRLQTTPHKDGLLCLHDRLENEGDPLVDRQVPVGHADITTLGVHAFEVASRWYPIPWPQVLKRAGRVRLLGSRGSGPVRWTRKKGVIGICWRTGGFVEADISDRVHGKPTKQQWKALGPDAMGMSYKDFVHTSARGAVIAEPIVRAGEVIGCVSIDGPPGRLDLLTSQEVAKAIRSAEGTLAALFHR